MKKQNLAARAGRWSAQHRKKAILGWFAFVIVATLIGGSLGTKTIASDEEGLAGDSRRAHEIVKETFPQAAGEQVFIQSKTAGLAERRLPRRRQGRRAAARRRQGRLEHPVPLRQAERRADLS